jgi:hypothetical protein
VAAHSEEEPEEPDEPDAPEGPDNGAAAPTRMVPTVSLPSREWEFSTHSLTVAQVVDGSSLVKVLKEQGAEGWELAQVIDGGDKRVLLMRRPKRAAREARRVGFAPPSQT